MNYALKSVNYMELSFVTNPAFRPVQGENTEFKQQFRVEKISKSPFPGAENIYVGGIRFEMNGSEEKPAPYSVVVHVRGAFEVVDIQNDQDMQTLQYAVVNVLLPYVRATAAQLVCTAGFPPVTIPLIPVTRLIQQPGDNGPSFKVKFDESLLA